MCVRDGDTAALRPTGLLHPGPKPTGLLHPGPGKRPRRPMGTSDKEKTNNFERMLQTPQPAHAAALAASLLLGLWLWPGEEDAPSRREGGAGPPSALLYLACFATHFGTQFWMTFASGLVLFRRLSRHEFGRVQRCLFPIYFAVQAALSLAALLLAPRLPLHQRLALLLRLAFELWARACVVPPLLRALARRTELEEGAGVGGPGLPAPPGPLAHCPHYASVNAAFRRLHALCACANVAAIACSALQLCHLAAWITRGPLSAP